MTTETAAIAPETFAWHGETIGGLLRSRAAVQPEAQALVFEERSYTWRELVDAVDRAAAFLAAQGVGVGKSVAVVASNSDAFVIAFIAVAELGAATVTINGELDAELVAATLARAGASLILVSPDRATALRNFAGLPVFSLGEDCDAGPSLLAASARLAPLSARAATPVSCCLVMFTSGTTGQPKGVMHSQRSFILAGEGFIRRMALDRDDRVLCVLPLFHINALFYSVAGALAAGAALIVARRFSASAFWATVADSGATQVNLIAAAGTILARRDIGEFRPGHALRKVYLAPLTREVHDFFQQHFMVPTIREGYGMTEVPGVINQPFDSPPEFGSMGRVSLHPSDGRPLAELRLSEVDGNTIEGPGEGELWVRTPMIMQGYFRDPAQTAEAIVDGWFRTGDLVRRTANDSYVFVERIKDIIRRRGENISGAELDRLISAYPEIAQVAVIPTRSELGEDDILAVLVPRGAAFSVADFFSWCQLTLPRMKIPRYVTVLKDLPRTPSQKVEKYKLRRDPSVRAAAIELAPDRPPH
ncbi:MAG: class I adenylate-forming enzyme family protein [Burkholderiales bacterium]